MNEKDVHSRYESLILTNDEEARLSLTAAVMIVVILRCAPVFDGERV